ncbi:hypothetical protein Val02_69040 [Virgisporangium aliadipatigenens]|uniref:Terminase small subunit n=2 Tax=Virgisporangium aliadipatigenens TaxID=741659 RepID=A0A8J3YUJ8_9ACTN|nr:hypothetical protein Val02_69040 [Virgisporangium aliadipatigenens]
MGTRGPVPKRSVERRRRNSTGITTQVQPQSQLNAPPLDFPAHPVAARWYASLAESGQSHFYEPSDWAAACLVAFDLTRHLNSGRVSAQMLAALWSAMGDLLTTEAARRRVRMEIDRSVDDGEADAARVAVMAAYRRGVGAS